MYINDGRTSYSTNQKRQLLSALYALEEKQPAINTPEDVVAQFLKYRNRRKEYFFSLSVDNKNQLLKKHEISRGTVDQTAVFPQEVIKATLFCSGSGIILGHNHPGGDPTPSEQDKTLTWKIQEGAKFLGLRLLDHVIVAKYGHFSFQEHGLI